MYYKESFVVECLFHKIFYIMNLYIATFSAAGIPEMLNACETKNNIDKRVSRFVIPFCVTLNADGSALYITVASIFIASISGADIGIGSMVTIG